jgi:hypothetical protein
MKNWCFLIVLFFPLVLLSQPEGKLFVHTGFVSNDELGYIQYPQNQYHVIDTTNLDDLITVDNNLLITNDKIYFYNINTLKKTDSIETTFANMLDYENNILVLSRTEAPYFEVYNYTTKSLLFSLDTNKVKNPAVDVLVDMGKAYLLYDTTVLIIDLVSQDTIANITATYNSWFPCYNTHLINNGDKIYINVGIATGAPRFAILSLNKSTRVVETVLFQEFIDASFEPVLADNKLYMSSFPSHYDIIADTFIYNQDHMWTYPLSFDNASNTMFLYNISGLDVSYFHNNVYSADVSLPTYLNKAVYYNEGGSDIADNVIENQVKIYPNPSSNVLNILLPNEKWVKGIRIVSLSGDNYVNIINSNILSRKIDISHLKDGMYFIEIQFENQTYKSKFIKTNSEN